MHEHELPLTRHARTRGAQRAIRGPQLELIVELGRRFYTAGAIFCFFGQREAARHAYLPPRVLEGILGGVVVLDTDGKRVLTVYRNNDAPRHIRRKVEYDLRTGRQAA